ncbi:MAG: membrane-bound lytic murein transglycosylase MltF [Betaproteobacteria bacterium]|nr:membrane-bound lytic murein transglycosylase MltF [Betaproteobacteria bacterium]
MSIKRTAILFAVTALLGAALAVWLSLKQTGIGPSWLMGPLKPPRASGELVILTLRGPTTTQSLPGAGKHPEEAQTGFEHDLASLFARELGARTRFVVAPSYAALVKSLREGRAHLAAAGLVPSIELKREFAFGPHYRLIQHQLAYHADNPRPRSLADTAGKRIATVAETPAHDLLRELTGDIPGLVLDVMPHETDPDDLLRRIEARQCDFALVDATALAVTKRLHPDVAAAFNVGREMKVAWAFGPTADYDLMQSAVQFFDKIRGNGTLSRLTDRYYGHVNRIQPVDSEALLEKIQTVLPKLKPFFQEAERVSGIDWRVIAAIGYQESHWDANATSPTGVRGLMMLTEDTADRMRVKNRLDPRESILGGAKYLGLLRDTVPPRVPEPDRTWLALAAYNQGYGHLEDARIVTQRMKLNPDSWLDVRKAYPKLRDPETYESLKYGFARGDEAVQFVENVRNYTDMLLRLEKPMENEIVRERSLTGEPVQAEVPVAVKK